MALTVLLLD